MDEREVEIIGKDENYWWFKAKDKLIEREVFRIGYNFGVLNIGAGIFNCWYAENYRGMVEKMPFNSNKYSIVILADVLEHVEKPKNALKEVKRVMSKGGKLIITVPAHTWLFGEHDKFLRHRCRYSKKMLIKELNAAGFKTIKLKYWNCNLFIPTVVRKLFNKEGSDLKKLHPTINKLLYWILKLEEYPIPRFPIGTTIFGVFEKC